MNWNIFRNADSKHAGKQTYEYEGNGQGEIQM